MIENLVRATKATFADRRVRVLAILLYTVVGLGFGAHMLWWPPEAGTGRSLTSIAGILAAIISVATMVIIDVTIRGRRVLGGSPASSLVACLRFLFSKRAFDRIFSQVINDGREEYFDALSERRHMLARYRLGQLYVSVVVAACAWIGVSTLKKVVQMWRIVP